MPEHDRYGGAGQVVVFVGLMVAGLLLAWAFLPARQSSAPPAVGVVPHAVPSAIEREARLLIETVPSHADIFVNGTHVGRSPVRVPIALQDDMVALEARHAGQQTHRRVRLAHHVTSARILIELGQ